MFHPKAARRQIYPFREEVPDTGPNHPLPIPDKVTRRAPQLLRRGSATRKNASSKAWRLTKNLYAEIAVTGDAKSRYHGDPIYRASNQ